MAPRRSPQFRRELISLSFLRNIQKIVYCQGIRYHRRENQRALYGFPRRFVKFLLLACLSCLLAIAGLSGCQQILQISQVTNQAAPFPTVAALPLPELSDWITEISPTGEAADLAQIRILFKHPLIPVAQLESPEETALLQKIELIPAISGQFRFLTPQMIGFQADQPLPKATRFQVTLKSGLGDLENNQLTEDLAWTFQTPQIRLSNLPGLSVPCPKRQNPWS